MPACVAACVPLRGKEAAQGRCAAAAPGDVARVVSVGHVPKMPRLARDIAAGRAVSPGGGGGGGTRTERESAATGAVVASMRAVVKVAVRVAVRMAVRMANASSGRTRTAAAPRLWRQNERIRGGACNRRCDRCNRRPRAAPQPTLVGRLEHLESASMGGRGLRVRCPPQETAAKFHTNNAVAIAAKEPRRRAASCSHRGQPTAAVLGSRPPRRPTRPTSTAWRELLAAHAAAPGALVGVRNRRDRWNLRRHARSAGAGEPRGRD